MSNYTKETLGIIGGCGVAAANELMCRIEKKLTELGCLDDRQQPEIILYQATLAPSRIAYAANKSRTAFAPYFINIGKKLKTCGATVCCIPCNTAHCCIGEIESSVGLPFINIITETLTVITESNPGLKRIGILGSLGTKFSKIYQEHSDAMNLSLEFIFPSENFQKLVDDGIAAVKSGLQYRDQRTSEKFFIPVADQIIDAGAEVIILGCTEIPLSVKIKEYKSCPIVDTLSILADACISKCKLS